MTNRQSGYVKIAGGVAALLVSVLTVVGIVNSGVDEKIDVKINTHSAESGLEQQKESEQIRRDIAVLDTKVDSLKDQGKHTQELVEQLIREN